MTDAADLLLPPGARLVHIGPPKTGTTSIQSALWQARAELAELGVVYPGRDAQHYKAALAVAGKPDIRGNARSDMKHWARLTRQVASAPDEQRVVISSEFFAEATGAKAQQVVAGLGGDRVHVVVTLRPLASILPSAWQQYVRNRVRTSYPDWLKIVFDSPPEVAETTSFWIRHAHDVLVKRWVDVVGPDRVTVVMLESSARDRVPRVFEQMLGLPDGLLVPVAGRENRSLTFGETEVIRRLNADWYRRKYPQDAYRRIVARAVVRSMTARTPEPDEARTMTPAWALERAAKRGAEAADNIAALGVRVIGDLSQLADVSAAAEGDNTRPFVPSKTAAAAIIEAIRVTAAGDSGLPGPAAPGPSAGPAQNQVAVGDASARVLARELGRHAVQWGRRRIKRRG